MKKVSFAKLKQRLGNSLVAAVFVAIQLGAALVPAVKASAAIVSSSVASTGFVVKNNSAYSVVAGQPTAGGDFKNGNVGSYPEGACIPAVFQVTNTSGGPGDLFVSPVFDYLKSGSKDLGFTQMEVTTSALSNVATGADNLNDMSFPGAGLQTATSFKTTTGATVNATVSGAYAGNDSSTTATSNSDTFRHYNVTLLNVANGVTVNVLTCGRLGLDSSEYNGSSLSMRTVQGGQENIPIPVNQILVLPSITITKAVTAGSALPTDFSFTVSPSVNGQSVFPITNGNSVTIPNVNPDGQYTITESGPAGYTFTGGTGTSCAVVANSVGTAAGKMTATVAAGKPATNATCNFTNTVQTGSITIIKDATPNNAQDFHFTTTGLSTDATGFNLDDDADATLSNTKVFSGLLPGNYSVTEAATTGWDNVSIDCGGAAGVTSSTQTGTTSIALAANQNVVCTYGNTQRGNITVNKTLSPSNDPGKFNLQINGATAGTGANVGNGGTTGAQSLSAGSGFTVGETAGTNTTLSDYTSSYSCLDNGSAFISGNGTTSSSFTLAPGHNVVCTFTNTRNTGSIHVDKRVDVDGDGIFETLNQGAFTWTLDGNGTNAMGSTVSGINTGSHNVGENSPAGYHFVGWYLTSDTSKSCANPAGTTLPIAASVTTGQTTNITLCNARDAGTLQVLKNVDLNGDGDYTDQGETGAITWQWKANGGSNHSTGDAPIIAPTGDYTLTESGPNDFHFVSLSCTGGVLTGSTVKVTTGANVVCTFVNARDTGLIGFLKQVIGGSSSPSDWTFNISDGSTAKSGDSKSYITGIYGLTESGPSGYTMTNATGACALVQGLVVLSVSTQGGLCTIVNTRDTGSVKVNKLLNNDTDSTFETINPATFSWNMGASTNNAMGSTLNGVETGPYTVTENSPAGYHFVGWYPTGSVDFSCASPFSKTLPANISVTKDTTTDITLCNARDTGTITVNKVVVGANDTGKFNLQVDGSTAGTGANVGNGGSTGTVPVLIGQHNAGEIAGDATSLSDYTSAYTCINGQQVVKAQGAGTTIGNFSVASNEAVVCTITNTKKGHIVVDKVTLPSGSTQSFDFTTSGTDYNGFSLTDAATPNSQQVVPGSYTVAETAVDGWDSDGGVCDNGETPTSLDVEAGETVTCTFTNTQQGSITIIKDANPDSSQEFKFTGNLGNFTLVDDGQNDTTDRKIFTGLAPGTYTTTEPAAGLKGWTLESITCVGGSDAKENNRNAVIKLQPGENVTCTFLNTRDTGDITVHKITNPSPDPDETDFTIRLRDDSKDQNIVKESVIADGESDSYNVVTGTYNLAEELIPNGWDLWSASCTVNDEGSFDPRDGSFELNKNDNVDCTFTNNKRADVIVNKYNDLNRNGQYDQGEELLPDWEFNLKSEGECEFPDILELGLVKIDETISDDCDPGYDQNRVTDQDGVAEFEDILPDKSYELSETIPADSNWHLGNITCDDEGEGQIGQVINNDYYLFANPGATVTCYVGNYRDAVLDIVKTNDRPNPTTVGDTVTYTLTVTVPEDSGEVFDTEVTDLPPAGFEYVLGSWTANSSVRGDIKGEQTPEPTYGSPGIWLLRNLVPGEVVTLTYKALIKSSVSDGKYPDIAFARGCSTSLGCVPQGNGNAIFANVSTGSTTPFVGTTVAVTSPAVLAATVTRYVNTGASNVWLNTLAAITLAGGALITLVRREKKGGKA